VVWTSRLLGLAGDRLGGHLGRAVEP
jgi:hypothetical protein